MKQVINMYFIYWNQQIIFWVMIDIMKLSIGLMIIEFQKLQQQRSFYNKGEMLKSIELSFEEQQDLLLVCQHCKNRIIPLRKATSFVKNTQYANTYYFLSQLQQQENHGIVVDPFSFYIEVAPPFQLMELGKVQCYKCRDEIGIFIKNSSEEETRWMSNCLLLNLDKLTFNKRQLRDQVISTLIYQINHLDQGQFNQKNTQTHQKQQVQAEEVNYQTLVKQSLSNIVFFSQAVDEIDNKIQNLIAIRKYQSVKLKSQKKKYTRRN